MSLDALNRVVVGSGHFQERATVIVEAVVRGAENGIQLAERTTNAFNRISNISVGERAFTEARHLESIARSHQLHYIGRSADQQSAHDRAADNLEKLGDAALDLASAYGYGAAGDLGSAYDKAVDAAMKTGEVFWDNATAPFR